MRAPPWLATQLLPQQGQPDPLGAPPRPWAPTPPWVPLTAAAAMVTGECRRILHGRRRHPAAATVSSFACAGANLALLVDGHPPVHAGRMGDRIRTLRAWSRAYIWSFGCWGALSLATMIALMVAMPPQWPAHKSSKWTTCVHQVLATGAFILHVRIWTVGHLRDMIWEHVLVVE